VLVIHATGDDAVGIEHAERIEELAGEHRKTDWAFARIEGGDHNFGAKGVVGDDLSIDDAMIDRLHAFIEGFLP
jgi:dipeptidyl aminopeptidase/acylaminoacyl peptidase